VIKAESQAMPNTHREDNCQDVRFEVFTAVTMKNGIFWVVTPCGSVPLSSG
jgi:hypothetical protein